MPLILNAYTPDTIAIGIIAEGRARNLDDLGIVCGIAGALPESGLVMYANEGDPPSLAFPYQKLSSDKNSDGIYQQRDPWWGTAADRMDVRRSAGMFFASLVKQKNPTYHEDAGVAIANVQQPREDLRWKYGARMGDAWAIFNRLKDAGGAPAPTVSAPPFTEINLIGERPISDNSQSRNGTPIDLLVGHTTEGAGGLDLVSFMEGAEVSYHTLIDNDLDGNTVYDLVDTDLASWSVLDANNRSINYVIGRSRAAWTRAEWISNARNAVRIMAYLMVQDARKYGVDPRVIPPPYNSDPPGITDHHYVTVHLGVGTHTDLGPNFIWDLLEQDVNEFANGISGDDDVPLVNQPSGSIYRESNKDLPWAGTPMDFIMDAQIHEGRVEQLAKDGVPKALALVQAVADGTSPVSDSLSDDARAQAQAILDVIAKPKTVRKPKAS